MVKKFMQQKSAKNCIGLTDLILGLINVYHLLFSPFPYILDLATTEKTQHNKICTLSCHVWEPKLET